MASIHRDIAIARSPEYAWEALRQYDAAAQLYAGVLVDCRCALAGSRWIDGAYPQMRTPERVTQRLA